MSDIFFKQYINLFKINLTNIFEKKPYKIGIALSGAGIKGLCHAGVLKALEEIDIKPNILSGVSA